MTEQTTELALFQESVLTHRIFDLGCCKDLAIKGGDEVLVEVRVEVIC